MTCFIAQCVINKNKAKYVRSGRGGKSGTQPLIGGETQPRRHGLASGRITTILTTTITVVNTENG